MTQPAGDNSPAGLWAAARRAWLWLTDITPPATPRSRCGSCRAPISATRIGLGTIWLAQGGGGLCDQAPNGVHQP
ncbi:hypothetical protein AB0395_44895 [Streptosporangium sp. NPDC051023]|uniref:hypothetical protein n=1 Tax=Streptosporangium sp. NPDC051023 TaxID=3155410 RepID=UPI00344E8394